MQVPLCKYKVEFYSGWCKWHVGTFDCSLCGIVWLGLAVWAGLEAEVVEVFYSYLQMHGMAALPCVSCVVEQWQNLASSTVCQYV